MTRPAPIDKRRMLERVSIFSQLAPAELDALLQIAASKRLRARETLLRKGDEGSQVYALMRGRLKVTAAGEDGKETVLRILDPGEVLGEIALLDGRPRSATVTALEPSELLVIQRRDLIPFLEQHPKVAIKLLEVVVGLVRSVSAQLEDTVFLNLPARLAKKLLALAETYGSEQPAGIQIDLRLSQHELGEMVGASRESINKQLRTWNAEGILLSERGFITIRDVGALEKAGGLTLS